MAKKRNTSLTTSGQQLEMTGTNKSIIKPQKVATRRSETPEDQLEKRSISPRWESFDPNLATFVYSLLYCSPTTLLSAIS